MYIDVYSCIFMYIDVYSCILMYIHVYSCILIYVGIYIYHLIKKIGKQKEKWENCKTSKLPKDKN